MQTCGGKIQFIVHIQAVFPLFDGRKGQKDIAILTERVGSFNGPEFSTLDLGDLAWWGEPCFAPGSIQANLDQRSIITYLCHDGLSLTVCLRNVEVSR